MADNEYIDLQGNEPLLKAVEYLRMLPEWKSKPGKLRTGYVEYAEVLARHLINIYCTLEGKPLTEKLELSKTLNPLAIDRERVIDTHGNQAAFTDHLKQLNTWHLELSILQKGIDRVIRELGDYDEELGAIGHVITHSFSSLVERCPFPSR